MTRAKFFIEIRIEGHDRWLRYDWWHYCDSAISRAKKVSACLIEENGAHAFPNVRVTYRGLTLIRWKDGDKVV